MHTEKSILNIRIFIILRALKVFLYKLKLRNGWNKICLFCTGQFPKFEKNMVSSNSCYEIPKSKVAIEKIHEEHLCALIK